ncbi:MAG TPA: VanZ family protein [Burkholderiales bacterium]|nr:VanZ family protein [Burkholderiales bacterium]
MTPGGLAHCVLRGSCFALAAALVFQLFYLGSQPAAVGLFDPPWDAIAHFLYYAALTALLWTATAGRMPLAVFAAVVIVGGLDELHQTRVPGRVADAADFLVDVGAATFICAAMLLLGALAGRARARPPGR